MTFALPLGGTLHDHEKERGIPFTDAINHSSNIGPSKIAIPLGEKKLYQYARAFGFGMSSGVGLPGDGTGILREPSQWRSSSLENISCGQEVGVTPLQMVNAYSALANGGLLLEPQLYKGYLDGQGNYREWES